MRLLEWEWLGRAEEFEVTELGPMPAGVTQGRLTRNAEMKIELVGRGPLKSEGLMPSIARAMSREYPDTPVAGFCNGELVEADGLLKVYPPSFSIREQRVEFSGQFQKASKSVGGNPASHVEWVLNMKLPGLAPFGTERCSRLVNVRTRQDGQQVEKEFERKGFSADFCSIRTGGDRLIRFGTAPSSVAPTDLLPGFVEFEFIPTDEEKLAWVEVISFVLGRRIYSVGWSRFDESFNPVELYAQDPGLGYKRERQGSANWIPSSDFVQKHRIEGSKLCAMSSGLWKAIRRFDLAHALGLYWYGWSAPIDVAPVIFGAALESLRDSYLGESSSKYLDDQNWNVVRQQLLQALTRVEATLSEGEILRAGAFEVFRTSIERMNVVSVSARNREFFARLELELGKVERDALRSRNKAAHGGRFGVEDVHVMDMRTRSLRTLFNRCLLRIAGVAQTYVDYSGGKVVDRPLAEAMGG